MARVPNVLRKHEYDTPTDPWAFSRRSIGQGHVEVLQRFLMLKTYIQLMALLDRHERRHFWMLIVMVLLVGFFDMLGVASVLPFLAVVANPGIIGTNAYLAAAYSKLGFTSTQGFLAFLGLCTFAVVVFGQCYKAAASYALTRYSAMREATVGSRLLDHYLQRPYSWFITNHTAELAKSLLSDVGNVINGALIPALRLLAQSAILAFLVALLVVVEPVAAIASAVLIGGAYTVVYIAVRRHLFRIGKRWARANVERFRIVSDAMGGIKEMKLRSLEESYVRQFGNPATCFAREQATSAILAELPRFLLEAVVFGGMILLVSVLLVMSDGRLENVLPIVGVYAFAGARMFPALQQIYAALAALRFSSSALDTLHAELSRTGDRPAHRHEVRSPSPLVLSRSLRLEDVHFTYPGATRPVLQGLTLEIEAGTMVGIVGPTGAGKTTAVDVLLGLLVPGSGSLRVDGATIEPAMIRDWQRTVGYVPQQIFLLDDSVAANIAFGVPRSEVHISAVERAARLAQLHDVVAGEFPQGYETRIGERGIRLSGGQRQRIGIARALYHEPSVLVLDEATSAVDNVTERAIIDAVSDLRRSTTVLMIAHRLSTVSKCDRIFVVDGGRCVAQGSYSTLLRTSRLFNDMVNAARTSDHRDRSDIGGRTVGLFSQ